MRLMCTINTYEYSHIKQYMYSYVNIYFIALFIISMPICIMNRDLFYGILININILILAILIKRKTYNLEDH